MAIVITGSVDERRKTVPRRATDDLPEIVKKNAFFEEHTTRTGQVLPQQGYYALSNDGAKQPVEFFNVNGVDQWYLLHWNALAREYYITEDDNLPFENSATGYWLITDPHHFDYVLPPPADSPLEYHDPAEQFLSGGLHHVLTLEGPQAQLSPTHLVLPVIEQAAAQGEVLRSKTFNGATCTIWLRRFWSSIFEGNADCNSNGRSKANP